MTSNLQAHLPWPPPTRSSGGFFQAPARRLSVTGGKLNRSGTHTKEVSDAVLEELPPLKRRKVTSPLTENEHSAGSSHSFQAAASTKDSKASQNARLRRVSRALSGSLSVEDGHVDEYMDPARASALNSAAPPALPTRPWRHNHPTRRISESNSGRSQPTLRRNVIVPTIPYTIESPDDAPMSEEHRLADFFPWIGNHPEDLLNEQTVKQGYFDRVQVSQNETNTAKSALHNIFKQRSGLQTLSALFVSALEQRDTHGKITAGSAFKPPPRVTLTEAKRRNWLGDLANPVVPLRKLSRTIPQGIRGQLLLDQCLTNSVPTSRAIWFAKCVGANEIRTLKRKGTSGAFAASAETKWLRDWTTNIEQFLEGIASHCGKPEWRTNANYSLRLATRLYYDNLVDRDHYLEWIIKSTATASLDLLPFWLMMVHVHLKDMTRFRKQARHLAEVLLCKVEIAQGSDETDLSPLVKKLKVLVRALASSRPSCFLLQPRWQQFEVVLQSCLHLDSRSESRIFDHIRRINERISRPLSAQTSEHFSSQQALIQVLDTAHAPYDVSQISKRCLEASNSSDHLITAVLRWSTTKFRHGRERVFLAVRLLRLWHRRGWDIDFAILGFIADNRQSQHMDTDCLHHIVSELVRSQTFSLSRYLQSLNARGALKPDCFKSSRSVLIRSRDGEENHIELQVCDDNAVRLLTSIPLVHLPGHLRSLRKSTLSRAGHSSKQEADAIDHCKHFINARIPGMSKMQDLQDEFEYSMPKFAELNWTIKSEIGHWLRAVVLAKHKTFLQDQKLAKDSNERPPVFSLTHEHFLFVRDILETTGDISMLADILSYAVQSQDESILASVADTVNKNFDSLSAIGALIDLHQSLQTSYLALKASGLPLPTLAISLINLGAYLPSEFLSIKTLLHDLARGDRSSATAAFSPFSDGVAESLQQAGSTFIEDFDAALLFGSNMAEQTMSQLFAVLVGRLEKERLDSTSDENLIALCHLLSRLRVFRTSQFDRHGREWIERLLSNAHSTSNERLLLCLISTNCVSMQGIFDVCKGMREKTRSRFDEEALQTVRQTIARLIRMGTAGHEISPDPLSYRFTLHFSRYMYDHPFDALESLTFAKMEANNIGYEFTHYIREWIHRLLSIIALNPHGVLSHIGEVATNTLATTIDELLRQSSTTAPTTLNIQSLLGNADDFSFPLCRIRLQIYFDKSTSKSDITNDSIVDGIFDLAKAGQNQERNGKWTSFVSALGPDAASRVREKAEEAFFATVLPFTQSRLGAPLPAHPSEASLQQLATYLDIVAKTAQTIPAIEGPHLASQLVEKFASVLRYLTNSSVPVPTSNAPPGQGISPLEHLPSLIAYLPMLLRMTSLHASAFSPAPAPSPSNTCSAASSKQTQQEQIKILVLLASIALHQALSSPTHASLVSHAFDVAALLVDEVSDEGRALVARFLKDKMRDPRALWLFGSVNSSSESDIAAGSGLQLVKDGRGIVGEYRVKQWELLEGGAEASLSLAMFKARVGRAV